MTTWSWCLLEQVNVEAGADRRCQNDGSTVIPPSFGNRTQTWREGAWWPEIVRPEGHLWKAPGSVAQVIADPVTDTCQQCDLTFSYRPKGGDAPRYCSPRCKGASARARRKAERAVV